MTETELKKCPHCKCEKIEIYAEMYWYATPPRQEYCYQCLGCGAKGAMTDTPEKAAEAWNTRPVEDALAANIERLERILSNYTNLNYWSGIPKGE